jgi:rubredoxin
VKPKRWRSARVCPVCGSRATKIFNLNSGKYKCQICRHEYDPPNTRRTVLDEPFRRLFGREAKAMLPLELTDAARSLGTSIQEASALLREMEAAGLVFMVSAPRVTGFYPTEKGVSLLVESTSDHLVIDDGFVTSVPMSFESATHLARSRGQRRPKISRTVVVRIVEVIDR